MSTNLLLGGGLLKLQCEPVAMVAARDVLVVVTVDNYVTSFCKHTRMPIHCFRAMGSVTEIVYIESLDALFTIERQADKVIALYMLYLKL